MNFHSSFPDMYLYTQVSFPSSTRMKHEILPGFLLGSRLISTGCVHLSKTLSKHVRTVNVVNMSTSLINLIIKRSVILVGKNFLMITQEVR